MPPVIVAPWVHSSLAMHAYKMMSQILFAVPKDLKSSISLEPWQRFLNFPYQTINGDLGIHQLAREFFGWTPGGSTVHT